MQKIYLAFGLSLLLAACGSSDNTKRGGLGESCTGKNDCNGTLVCLSNICQPPGTVVQTPDGGGTTTPIGPVLSAVGESCTKTADCVTGAKCFSGVCALTPPPPAQPDAAIIYVVVDAGAPTNPVLSARGETCGKSSDCEPGLICLPISATTGLGVCDFENYGFATGTNTCSAECKEDKDCCELPLGTMITMPDTGTSVTANSCADIAKALKMATPTVDGTDCNTNDTVSHECFLYRTYCNCGSSNYWKCTAQRCSYNNSCDPAVTGEVMDGCPTKSRAGFALPGCNAGKTCGAAAATGGCKNDTECTGKPIADGAGETCTATGTALECTCVASSGLCYRRCATDLDCAPGYTCDTATMHLCKPAGACSIDSDCAKKLKNVTAKCVASATDATAKACRVPCKTDQDCSPSGLAGSVFTGSICGKDGYCGTTGCSSDLDCASEAATGTGSVKMFCVAPTTGAAGTAWASAITGGSR